MYLIYAILAIGAVVGAAGLFAIQLVVKNFSYRKLRELETESSTRANQYKESELRRKRDHQNNHARRVTNWLKQQLQVYGAIEIVSFQQPSGAFTIHVELVSSGERINLIQITYDFVSYTEPYCGHIHYGAYGADLLFWVGDHAPFSCLEELVIEKVRRRVERKPVGVVIES